MPLKSINHKSELIHHKTKQLTNHKSVFDKSSFLFYKDFLKISIYFQTFRTQVAGICAAIWKCIYTSSLNSSWKIPISTLVLSIICYLVTWLHRVGMQLLVDVFHKPSKPFAIFFWNLSPLFIANDRIPVASICTATHKVHIPGWLEFCPGNLNFYIAIAL